MEDTGKSQNTQDLIAISPNYRWDNVQEWALTQPITRAFQAYRGFLVMVTGNPGPLTDPFGCFLHEFACTYKVY